jgi:hypothetical protein
MLMACSVPAPPSLSRKVSPDAAAGALVSLFCRSDMGVGILIASIMQFSPTTGSKTIALPVISQSWL